MGFKGVYNERISLMLYINKCYRDLKESWSKTLHGGEKYMRLIYTITFYSDETAFYYIGLMACAQICQCSCPVAYFDEYIDYL